MLGVFLVNSGEKILFYLLNLKLEASSNTVTNIQTLVWNFTPSDFYHSICKPLDLMPGVK
jgi:hypothetical protein